MMRKIWAGYINFHDVISLKNKNDDKFLHEYLLVLAKDYSTKKVRDTKLITG